MSNRNGSWAPATPEFVYQQWLRRQSNVKVWEAYNLQLNNGTNPNLLEIAKAELERRDAKGSLHKNYIVTVTLRTSVEIKATNGQVAANVARYDVHESYPDLMISSVAVHEVQEPEL